MPWWLQNILIFLANGVLRALVALAILVGLIYGCVLAAPGDDDSDDWLGFTILFFSFLLLGWATTGRRDDD